MTLLQELQARICAKSTQCGPLLFLSAESKLRDPARGEDIIHNVPSVDPSTSVKGAGVRLQRVHFRLGDPLIAQSPPRINFDRVAQSALAHGSLQNKEEHRPRIAFAESSFISSRSAK
jgi:hypothetical protein